MGNQSHFSATALIFQHVEATTLFEAQLSTLQEMGENKQSSILPECMKEPDRLAKLLYFGMTV